MSTGTKLRDVRLTTPCDSDDLDEDALDEFRELIEEAGCVIPNIDIE